jgi:hypothetical protein
MRRIGKPGAYVQSLAAHRRFFKALIVFPNAKVNIQTPDNQVQNVYVVEGSSLVERLEQLAQSGSWR